DCRAGPSRGHGRVAALWRRAVVSHPGGNRRVDALPGGRGDRLARLCASPPGGALRTCAREPPPRTHLGVLAPTAVLYSRRRHARASRTPAAQDDPAGEPETPAAPAATGSF